MLIYGDISTNKTDILIEKYAELLNKGISSDEILVIVQNPKLKEEFIENTKKLLEIKALTKFNVYTYFGLCYNFVSEFYPVLENKIIKGKTEIFPNLCGLEASRHIFKNTIDEFNFKGYNSKTNLMHQLLRRQSLITLNALDDNEIQEKSRILTESFTTEIKNAINMYKQKTLEYRAFDYLRQVQLFSYLYKNVKNPYKYVFIDDADEIVPSLFEYLKYIKNSVNEFFIAYDFLGTSRKGYLCASENNFELFLNESARRLQNNKTADLIQSEISIGNSVNIENLKIKDFIRADEMTDAVINDINNLINKGVKPKDILVVIPEDNEYMKLYLSKIEAPYNFISGSEKIEDNKTVHSILNIIKILIEPDTFKISPYSLMGFLGQIFKLDITSTVKITQQYQADFCEKNLFEIFDEYKNEGNIKKFLEIKDEIKDKQLSEILYVLAYNFVQSEEDIRKINSLLKQLRDFEKIFQNEVSRKELLEQLENTIISENPLEDDRLNENAVNISTAQKAIDFKLKNKYMFLLDTTNSNWVKQDIGPLYNAWVFSKNWYKKDFTLNDNIYLSQDKISRQLRKLYLLNYGEITSYSSVYDFLGKENFKGIKHFFIKNTESPKPKFKIIPRPDQKPVLDYKEGKFAVMAVAGAGKTTIMLALILKLLEEGIKSENIFVLTYMDSAAKTFKERIKLNCPDLFELPNISTIHGLAMRVLRENNNHAHLGLDVDFDIIDEIKREKLIQEILFNEGLEVKLVNTYSRAISAFKNSKNKIDSPKTPLFKRIYSEYQKYLKNLNLIDYDDLLILALELLKTNSKIREYYQNLAHYVIEDEAQDSSAIQQELINIISKKYGNVIRCGDINQAITGTFTNSDTKGFKNFIENNNNCKMNYTLRNSTGVINLANELIQKGLKLSETSFFDIETKPVFGKNIQDLNACEFKIFEKENEEKDFILKKINEIYETDNNASIGILTRTNKEADIWVEYLKIRTKRKVTSKGDNVSKNPVFKTVLSVFNFILNPMNNKIISEFAQNMINLGFYKDEVKIFDKLKEDKPFILDNNEDFLIWWDLRYFLEFTVLNPYEAAFKIGEFYFKNDKNKKVNIAPISALISKIYNVEGNFESTLIRLNSIKQKGISFNIAVENEDKEVKTGEIKVLTIHKSKGDEFDYVFIPSLTSKNMGLKLKDIKLKDDNKILRQIQNPNKKDDDIKKEIMDENLRLLYVGITRAKNKLYLTSSTEYKIFNKFEKVEPSYLFELLQ